MANKLRYKQIIDKIKQCPGLKFHPILDSSTSQQNKNTNIQTTKFGTN